MTCIHSPGRECNLSVQVSRVPYCSILLLAASLFSGIQASLKPPYLILQGTNALYRRYTRSTFRAMSMTARILIVEDEMLVALELESILHDLGYEVAGIAADLGAATAHFEEKIDLALVDLNLRDGMTGPQIGALLCSKGVSVLFVTANPLLLGDGIAGAIGVITKPTDASMVSSAVGYAMAVRGGAEPKPPPYLRLFG